MQACREAVVVKAGATVEVHAGDGRAVGLVGAVNGLCPEYGRGPGYDLA